MKSGQRATRSSALISTDCCNVLGYNTTVQKHQRQTLLSSAAEYKARSISIQSDARTMSVDVHIVPYRPTRHCIYCKAHADTETRLR